MLRNLKGFVVLANPRPREIGSRKYSYARQFVRFELDIGDKARRSLEIKEGNDSKLLEGKKGGSFLELPEERANYFSGAPRLKLIASIKLQLEFCSIIKPSLFACQF